MGNYAITFLTFISQVRLYHWQTTSYAAHKALGELYDSISELADSFIETYIGKYGREQPGMSAAVAINFDPASTLDKINEFEMFLLGMELPDTDLLNIRDEMTAALKQTKYLLTLI